MADIVLSSFASRAPRPAARTAGGGSAPPGAPGCRARRVPRDPRCAVPSAPAAVAAAGPVRPRRFRVPAVPSPKCSGFLLGPGKRRSRLGSDGPGSALASSILKARHRDGSAGDPRCRLHCRVTAQGHCLLPDVSCGDEADGVARAADLCRAADWRRVPRRPAAGVKSKSSGAKDQGWGSGQAAPGNKQTCF